MSKELTPALFNCSKCGGPVRKADAANGECAYCGVGISLEAMQMILRQGIDRKVNPLVTKGIVEVIGRSSWFILDEAIKRFGKKAHKTEFGQVTINAALTAINKFLDLVYEAEEEEEEEYDVADLIERLRVVHFDFPDDPSIESYMYGYTFGLACIQASQKLIGEMGTSRGLANILVEAMGYLSGVDV